MKNLALKILILAVSGLFAQNVQAQLSACGANSNGQLGNGSAGFTPLFPTNLNNDGVTGICAGVNFSMFLNSDGTVSTSGQNTNGQLGDGTTTQRTSPTLVAGITQVKQIACGGYHSMVLLEDNTVWAWGWNVDGQIGDGTNTQRNSPVQVSGLTDVAAIAAGDRHSLALKTDGTVRTWGYNLLGQLGDGTFINRSTPIQPSGLTDIIGLDGGREMTIWLKADGTVWVAGRNQYGFLGNGTASSTSYQTTPVQVPNLTDVRQISSGLIHLAALKTDGTVWTWGNDEKGTIGDGAPSALGHQLTPYQIPTLSDITDIDAGDGQTFVRKRDGAVWAWGWNITGGLGNGTIDNVTPVCNCRSTPVQTNIGTENAVLGGNGNGHAFAAKPRISTAIGTNIKHYGSNVRLAFDSVTASGLTTYTAIDVTATGLIVPLFYVVKANAPAYQISTTAAVSGNIDVCLYAPIEFSSTIFNRLAILHGEGANLVDRTFSKDFRKREVCGRVSSLSPFVIAENLTPLAANASIGGRVTASNGQGINNARVSVTNLNGESRTARTNAFGYYQFDELPVGETYIVQVSGKRHQFLAQTITLMENLDGVNFTPID